MKAVGHLLLLLGLFQSSMAKRWKYPWETEKTSTFGLQNNQEWDKNVKSYANVQPLKLDKPAWSECSSLPFWKEYSSGGINVDLSKLYIVDNSKIIKDYVNGRTRYTLQAANVALDDIARYLLTQKQEPMIVDILATRIYFSKPEELQDAPFVCQSITNNVKRLLKLPPQIDLRITTARLETPWLDMPTACFDIAKLDENRKPPILQLSGGTVLINTNTVIGPGIEFSGTLKTNQPIPDAVKKLVLGSEVALEMLYACGRSLVGWNLRSSNLAQVKAGWQLTKDVSQVINSISLGGEMQALALQSASVATKVNSFFKFEKSQVQGQLESSSSMRFQDSVMDIVVPEWSVPTLIAQMMAYSSAAINYQQVIRNALNRDLTVGAVMDGILKDGVNMYTETIKSRKFAVEQTAIQIKQYIKAVQDAQAEIVKECEPMQTLTDRFSKGLKAESDRAFSHSVFDLFGLVAGAVSSREIKWQYQALPADAVNWKAEKRFSYIFSIVGNVAEGVTNVLKGYFTSLFIGGMSTYDTVAKSIFEQIKGMVAMLNQASFDLPIDQQSTNRTLLLEISSFDRSTVDALLIKLDQIRGSLDANFQFALDQMVDGAPELAVQLKRIIVQSKRHLNAVSGLLDTLQEWARQISDYASAVEMRDWMTKVQKEGDVNKPKNRAELLAWAMPGMRSVYDVFLEELIGICNGYYYATASDCPVGKLEPFRIQGMDEFLVQVQGTLNAIDEASPITLQAWNTFTRPITVEITHPLPSAQIIKNFIKTGLYTTNVELVGVKPAQDGFDKVYVWTDTNGVAIQRKLGSPSTLVRFKPPPTSIRSEYSINGGRTRYNSPVWLVEGKLYEADKRFCRTPFQDLTLRLGEASSTLDLSGLTAIKLYMNGYAQMGDDLKSVGSGLVNFEGPVDYRGPPLTAGSNDRFGKLYASEPVAITVWL